MKLNNKGLVLGVELAMVLGVITFGVVHHYVTTGENIFKAKPKTVDTIEQPAQCVDCNFGFNNFK